MTASFYFLGPAVLNESIIRIIIRPMDDIDEGYIYFDHSATTPVLPEVIDTITKALKEDYGNPSELHSLGQKASEVLEESRFSIGRIINARPSELVFTGSGTEGDNMAIIGVAEANRKKGDHIIISSIEHPAVYMPAKILSRRGYRVSFLAVDRNGVIDIDSLKKTISKKTILVSVMHANNIVGTVQPIKEIGQICKSNGVLFHTDAIQSFCKIKTDVDELGVDLLTISGHKIYGPKGVGALYIRKGTRIMPIIFGGGQEKGRRPGTVNVPLIAGMAKAASLTSRNMSEKGKRLQDMGDHLKDKVLSSIEDVSFNGHPTNRLPGHINFTIKRIEGEAMVLKLDNKKIAVSSGSACSASSLKPSRTLVSMGIPGDEAASSLRITLGYENTYEQIDFFVETLKQIVKELRSISPL